MKVLRTMILPLEKAREMVANWYLDLLVSDRANLLNLILGGNWREFVPMVGVMKPAELAECMRDVRFKAVADIASFYALEKVFIDAGNGCYLLVWNCKEKNLQDVSMLES